MRLNEALNQLLGALDGADAAATSQQLDMVNQVEAALEQQRAAWKRLKERDLAAVNRQLRQATLKEITIAK